MRRCDWWERSSRAFAGLVVVVLGFRRCTVVVFGVDTTTRFVVGTAGAPWGSSAWGACYLGPVGAGRRGHAARARRFLPNGSRFLAAALSRLGPGPSRGRRSPVSHRDNFGRCRRRRHAKGARWARCAKGGGGEGGGREGGRGERGRGRGGRGTPCGRCRRMTGGVVVGFGPLQRHGSSGRREGGGRRDGLRLCLAHGLQVSRLSDFLVTSQDRQP